MTADKAIGIIRWHQESANTGPITAYSLTRGSVEAAEAAIRLAFAALEVVESFAPGAVIPNKEWIMEVAHGVMEDRRARLEAKRDADEC